MHDTRGHVTRLLRSWTGGDPAALDALVPLVYAELHAIARRLMAREGRAHTLQPTALVHEAYARLVDARVGLRDRAHFLAIAARTMRRVLVEHARARGRLRRGGDWRRVTFDDALGTVDPNADTFLALDDALCGLAGFDERKSRAVELHYFGGLTHAEVAMVLEISEATVDRDLRIARGWLHRQLADGADHGP